MTKIGQSRGDTWENKVAHYFRDICTIWNARRLAPSSQENPDVLVTYQNKIFAFECKASTQNNVVVELDQLLNAIDFLEIFDYYPLKYVSIAWYYLGKTRDKQTKKYISRDIRTYIISWEKENFFNLVKKFYFDDYLPMESKLSGIECTYEGSIRYRIKKTVKKDVQVLDKLDESIFNKEIKEQFPYIKSHSLEQFKNTFEHIADLKLLGGGYISSIDNKRFNIS